MTYPFVSTYRQLLRSAALQLINKNYSPNLTKHSCTQHALRKVSPKARSLIRIAKSSYRVIRPCIANKKRITIVPINCYARILAGAVNGRLDLAKLWHSVQRSCPIEKTGCWIREMINSSNKYPL
ncbi:hypothetical protein DSO57_1014878 [Entomophthora muscae]|uniref:Uncharacterized protein n=1 Tax=Entomophthora muscae TaxID=34485 RepID=A0ACC2TT31_9FUNG|nr:hypothetical protein DSO57_1014878 [Entomophthora muscae]